MSAKPNLTLHAGVSGYFDISVLHADGTRTDYPRFKNLVTQQGLDKIGASGNASTGVAVGTGNTAPAAGNTTLQAQIAQQNLTQSSISYVATGTTAGPYSFANTSQYKFAVGAVVGNIAEIGATINGSTTLVFSRALIQVAGSPGTITVISSDQLIVQYTWVVQIAGDVSGTFNINLNGTPTSFNYSMRAYGINSNGQYGVVPTGIGYSLSFLNSGSSSATALISAQGTPSGTTSFDTTAFSAYVNGTNTINFTGNMGSGHTLTMQAFYFPLYPIGLQLVLNNPISLTSAEAFSITIAFSWSSM